MYHIREKTICGAKLLPSDRVSAQQLVLISAKEPLCFPAMPPAPLFPPLLRERCKTPVSASHITRYRNSNGENLCIRANERQLITASASPFYTLSIQLLSHTIFQSRLDSLSCSCSGISPEKLERASLIVDISHQKPLENCHLVGIN